MVVGDTSSISPATGGDCMSQLSSPSEVSKYYPWTHSNGSPHRHRSMNRFGEGISLIRALGHGRGFGGGGDELRGEPGERRKLCDLLCGGVAELVYRLTLSWVLP